LAADSVIAPESTQAHPAYETGVHPRQSFTDVRHGVDSLAGFFNEQTGLCDTTRWWTAANALTATIDYALATGDHHYAKQIANTYTKNLTAGNGNFTNTYIDDTGYWALA
jgi:hypothetical protein